MITFEYEDFPNLARCPSELSRFVQAFMKDIEPDMDYCITVNVEKDGKLLVSWMAVN